MEKFIKNWHRMAKGGQEWRKLCKNLYGKFEKNCIKNRGKTTSKIALKISEKSR